MATAAETNSHNSTQKIIISYSVSSKPKLWSKTADYFGSRVNLVNIRMQINILNFTDSVRLDLRRGVECILASSAVSL